MKTQKEITISGVGGQVDFVRGANMSKGGRAIMAMPATTGKGKISKIVPFLDKGAEVTTSRNDVNYVITEYGIAQLRGKNLRQRAEALMNVLDFHERICFGHRMLLLYFTLLMSGAFEGSVSLIGRLREAFDRFIRFSITFKTTLATDVIRR